MANHTEGTTISEVKRLFYKMLAAKERHRDNPTFENNLTRINAINAYQSEVRKLTFPQVKQLQQENQRDLVNA